MSLSVYFYMYVLHSCIRVCAYDYACASVRLLHNIYDIISDHYEDLDIKKNSKIYIYLDVFNASLFVI